MADGSGELSECLSRFEQRTTNGERPISSHEQFQQTTIAWDSGLMIL
ncbi:hypothetical protein BVRB_5g118300 [Beta vulgaris subsp. vulgaris]|nr:hypothetical protein BVRB_5g118300 [Beta vulgaris subsp. vulgaris]